MRRLSLLLAVGLAATLVVPAAQSGTNVRRMTVKVLSLTRVTVPHDSAPKQKENKGDWIEYQDLLLTTGPLFGKKKKNLPIGWDAGTQTFTSATGRLVRQVTTFPGQGTIKVRGVMKEHANGTLTVPIVGGTGSFKGAAGVLVIGKAFGPSELQAINTYRLKLPGGPVA